MIGLARLLFHLRGIEQGRDDRGRAYPNSYPGLDQLAAALFVAAVETVLAVRHAQPSMAFERPWKPA